MKAVVCTDFGEWSIENVPRPEPTDNEALLAIKRVQLSVTECQQFHGKAVSGRDSVHDRMRNGDGRVFGHEFVGEVIETGTEVERLEIGDRVYAPAKIACGSCSYCEAGYQNLCENLTTIGNGCPGALSEYLTVPANVLRTLSEGVSDAEGAALQPLASAILCAHDGQIQTGDSVAIVGAGVMGSHVGQLALIDNASEVYAIDVVPEKLEFAAERGMWPVNATEVEPISTIRNGTNGVGVDVVVSAVGGDQSHMMAGDDPIAQAFEMVRKGGTILQVGVLQGDLTVKPGTMRSKEVSWINPRHGAWSFGPNSDTGDLAVDFVADERVDIGAYITHEVEGLDAFEKAVEITSNKSEHGALGPAQIVLTK